MDMNLDVSGEYFQQKKALLSQCLGLSEELLGSLENWESFPDILARREDVIRKLKEL